MSLTLNEVRNIKFRMAKRSGYEVLDVDEFVDHVEEGLIQLLEENENLKRQLDSLQSGQDHQSDQGSAQPVEGGEHHVDQADDSADQADHNARPTDASAESGPVAESAVAGSVQPQSGQTGPEVGAEKIVVTTSREASTAVVRLVQLSTEQAEKLVEEAEEDAGQIRDEANRNAHQVTTDAQTRAERIESEARVNAERVRSDSEGRASQLDQDTDSRRRDLFSGLERERDQLSGSVVELRQFEAQYRQNLTSHLQAQLEAVGGHHGEPEAVPALMNAQNAPGQGETDGRGDSEGQHQSNEGESPRGRRDGAEDQSATDGGSETPRLDALLGDH